MAVHPGGGVVVSASISWFSIPPPQRRKITRGKRARVARVTGRVMRRQRIVSCTLVHGGTHPASRRRLRGPVQIGHQLAQSVAASLNQRMQRDLCRRAAPPDARRQPRLVHHDLLEQACGVDVVIALLGQQLFQPQPGLGETAAFSGSAISAPIPSFASRPRAKPSAQGQPCSMPRKGQMRRFSWNTWSSRKRRSCDNCATVRWVLPASSQSWCMRWVRGSGLSSITCGSANARSDVRSGLPADCWHQEIPERAEAAADPNRRWYRARP